jgi:uncharacterized repeat protein (TIGR01451 family)
MIPSSDLSVTISDSPDPVGAGDNISYLIAVTNNGPGDASGVTLTDIIPAGTTFVSFTQTAGPAFLSAGGNGGTVTATLANFPNGATATFELVVAADASLGAGVIVSNTVSITSANPDPVPGNESDTATTTTLDDTAPLAPTMAAPAEGALTNDSRPTIAGTAEPGSTVTVIVDTVPLDTTTTADGSGNWSLTLATPLADGSHTFEATATDAASNTSPESSPVTARIDATAPTATIALSDTALTLGETSLVTIAFSEAVGGFTTDDVTVEGGTLSPVSSSDGGVTWTATFTPLDGLEDAGNVVTLDLSGVTDLAGNGGAGVATSANYTIDTRPVVVPPAPPPVVLPPQSNQAPAAVTLIDPVSPAPEGGAAVKVADISVTDDELGTEVLSLVGTDAGSFEIRGTELWFRGYADFEAKAAYAVQVKATDEQGLSATSATFTLAIGDLPDTATAGADEIVLGTGDNFVNALEGDDQVAGGAGSDNLRGAGGDDTLLGGAGNNVLRGNFGNDRLEGGGGDDTLKGGRGADILIGGEGADTFVFLVGQDSPVRGSDRILDFSREEGDVIDLGWLPGVPTWRGERGFTGSEGEVRFEQQRGDTVVLADLDGDRQADLRIRLEGLIDLTKSDVLL